MSAAADIIHDVQLDLSEADAHLVRAEGSKSQVSVAVKRCALESLAEAAARLNRAQRILESELFET